MQVAFLKMNDRQLCFGVAFVIYSSCSNSMMLSNVFFFVRIISTQKG